MGFFILIASGNIELNPETDSIYDQDFKLLSKFKGIKIIYFNITSIRNKFSEIKAFCSQLKPHILTLSET